MRVGLSSCYFVLNLCLLFIFNYAAYLPVQPPWSLSATTFTPHWNVLTLHCTHLFLEGCHFCDVDGPLNTFTRCKAPNSFLIPSKFALLKSNNLTPLPQTSNLNNRVEHLLYCGLLSTDSSRTICQVTISPSMSCFSLNTVLALTQISTSPLLFSIRSHL